MTATQKASARQAYAGQWRPGLIGLLLVSLLASAWALWWPREEPYLMPHVEPSQATLAKHASTPEPDGAPVSSSPSAIERAKQASIPTVLSEATRDPFHTDLPKVAAASQPAREPERQERASALPSPGAAPPMEHRVMGVFTTPEGERLVVLQDGVHAVTAASGVTMSSGYVIEGVANHEIRLRHPLADQPVSLSIPVGSAP
jgi:hypothetical protein